MSLPSNAPPPQASLAPAPIEETQPRYKQWFEAYGTAVYNYFRFHVPLPYVAEDLTAETFLKVVRAEQRFDTSQGSPRAWILTVARNVLADWRRRARLRQYVALGLMHDLVYDAPSPEERILKEEEVGRVLDPVAVLGPADRELISLRYGSGLESPRWRRSSVSAPALSAPGSGGRSTDSGTHWNHERR